MRFRAEAVLRELAVVLLFLLLTVVMTWPLVLHLDRAISDPGDPFLVSWILDWGYHATTHGLPLFHGNILHPARYSLAFSEHMYGLTLLLSPLFAAGVAPLTIHNIALLLGFALSGYAAFLLARHVTGSTAAALVGGIAFAFIGFRFHHLPHLPYIWTVWLPLLLLAVLLYIERPCWRNALLFGGALLMNGLTTLHYFVFGAPAAFASLLFLAAYRRQWTLRFWLRIAAVTGVVLLALAPFLIPYSIVSETYGMQRTYQEVLAGSGQYGDWLLPNLQNRNYGHLSPHAAYSHERTLFPGFLIIGLAFAGLFLTRRGDFSPGAGDLAEEAPHKPRIVLRLLEATIALGLIAAWFGMLAGTVNLGPLSYTGASAPLVISALLLIIRFWMLRDLDALKKAFSVRRYPPGLGASLVWLVIGAVGATGLHGFLYAFLFDRFAVLRGIRMPVRWVILAYVALAVLAAVGMLPLLRNRGQFARAAVTAVVATLLLLELRAAPIRWYLVPLDQRAVYEWIRDTPIRGAVVELPVADFAAYEYVWRATVHHKPLANGVSGFMPPHYGRLVDLFERDPIPMELFDHLEEIKCSILVVHAGWLRERDEAIRDWLQRGLADGRIAFIRRFNAGPRSDWVFALTSVEPQSDRWRPPETADPAGRLPSENLSLFLERGDWTWTDETYAFVDRMPEGILRGSLHLSGWAHADLGVGEVRLRFANGRLVVPARLYERQDVQAVMPWRTFPQVTGFEAKVALPSFIDGETDFQVEIIDTHGRSRYMAPNLFTWRDVVPASMNWNPAALEALLVRLDADPGRHAPRILDGSAAITDFTAGLVSDPLFETDLEFARRVTSILMGEHPSPRLVSRAMKLLTRGASRERVIQSIVDSREFRERHTRS
jgi:hypothetical protein